MNEIYETKSIIALLETATDMLKMGEETLDNKLFASGLRYSPEPPASGRLIPIGPFAAHVVESTDNAKLTIDGLQIGEFYLPVDAETGPPLEKALWPTITDYLTGWTTHELP